MSNASHAAPEDDDELTDAQLREMDGEQVMDLFCETLGIASADVEYDPEHSDEDCEVWTIRVPRDELFEAAFRYLARPSAARADREDAERWRLVLPHLLFETFAADDEGAKPQYLVMFRDLAIHVPSGHYEDVASAIDAARRSQGAIGGEHG